MKEKWMGQEEDQVIQLWKYGRQVESVKEKQYELVYRYGRNMSCF